MIYLENLVQQGLSINGIPTCNQVIKIVIEVGIPLITSKLM